MGRQDSTEQHSALGFVTNCAVDGITHRRLTILCLAYTAFIFYGTLIPFQAGSWDAAQDKLAQVSRIPFVDSDGSRVSIPDVVQNVLFFMPFGFLGFLVLRQSRAARILIIAVASVLISALVELLQLFTIDRVSSVTDVVTNFVGGTTGACLAWLTLDAVTNWVSDDWKKWFARREYSFPVLVASVVVILGALQPFDFTLDVGVVGSRIKSILHASFDFGGVIRDEGVVFFHLFLLGYASQLWFRETTGRTGWRWALGYSVFLAIALEGMQIIVQSRMPDLRDMLVAAGGACTGVLVCKVFHPSMSRRMGVILVLLATAITSVIQATSPFRLADQYRSMNWIPFLAYYERTSFVALSNFIESILMYFPLGFVLQYLHPGKRLVLPVTVLIGSGVFLLESAQGCISGRYPDVTDVLGAVLGGIVGCWVSQARWRSRQPC